MIVFSHVDKTLEGKSGSRRVFENVSVELPDDGVVGILGAEGTGKSMLANMLCGRVRPDSGELRLDKSISWPIGDASVLTPAMSGRDNTLFIGRLYGQDLHRLVARAEKLAGLGKDFYKPVKTYDGAMKLRMSLALSYAMDFGCYVSTGKLSVRDRAYHRDFSLAFEQTKKGAGVILLTKNAHLVRRHCNLVAVISDHTVKVFENKNEGIKYFKSNEGSRWRRKPENPDRGEVEQEQERQEEVM